MYGIIAAILNMVIIMVLGDWTASGVEKTLGLPGVSLPHGFTTALVDRDILAAPSAYPNVAAPDPNIDFRRVTNLDAYLRRHAQVLTCSLDDPAQWQPGDIVVFGDMDHIGICSDRRNRSGVPFLIHHGNPVDGAVEHDDMRKMPITGHYRWDGSRI